MEGFRNANVFATPGYRLAHTVRSKSEFHSNRSLKVCGAVPSEFVSSYGARMYCSTVIDYILWREMETCVSDLLLISVRMAS